MSRMSQIEDVRTDESNVNDKKLKLDSDAVSSCTDSMETDRNVEDTKLSSEIVNSGITVSSEAALEDGQGLGSSEWTSGRDHIEQTVNDGPDMAALERLRSGQTYDAQEEYYDNEEDYSEAQTAAYNTAKEKYEFFWHSDSIYSQWHNSGFEVDGRWFSCAEQYMMYGKAVTFKDFKTARKILYSKDPRKMKALGREVQNFDPFTWQCYCLYIVKEGNLAKFSQNEDLKKAILATYPKVLVEASPKDKIWGIGFAEDHPLAWNEDTWEGTNYLGYVLTEVRDELLQLPEENRVNYIYKLLKDSHMEPEMIQAIQPNGYKPNAEEQRELNEEHKSEKHKGGQENHWNNEQERGGGKHTVPRDNNDDGARRRNDHGHGETQRHQSRSYGGEGRNNSTSDSNWRDAPRKEAGRDKWEGGRGKNYQGKQHRDADHSERDLYEYFWGQDNFYSQFYPTKFEVDNQLFSCAEQYMMYMKARVFGDDEIAREILRTKDPIKIKGLGRKVKNFDDDVWQKESLQLVKRGNIAKFSQNEKLKRVIMKTHPKILVEASPHDKIWGIGLAEDDVRAWRKATWQGTNFLGYILTEVRDEIMAREKQIEEKDKKVFLPDLQKQYAGAVKNRFISRDNTGGWAKHNQGGHDSQYQGGTQRQGADDNNKTSRDASSTTAARSVIPGANFVEENKSKNKKKKKKNKGKEENQEGHLKDWWGEHDDFQVPDSALGFEQKQNNNEAQTKHTENSTVKSTTAQVPRENNNEGEELQNTEGKGQKAQIEHTENPSVKSKGIPGEELLTTERKGQNKSVEKKEVSKSDDGWETAKGKKGKRQGSPEKSEVQGSKGNDSSDNNPRKTKAANTDINSKDHSAAKSEAVPKTIEHEAGSHSPGKEETKKEKTDGNPGGMSRRQKRNQKRNK